MKGEEVMSVFILGVGPSSKMARPGKLRERALPHRTKEPRPQQGPQPWASGHLINFAGDIFEGGLVDTPL